MRGEYLSVNILNSNGNSIETVTCNSPIKEYYPLYRNGEVFIQACNVQDAFLNRMRTQRTKVTLYLMNGFQLKGIIEAFDHYTVAVRTISDQKQNIIFKHAISTIEPEQAVPYQQFFPILILSDIWYISRYKVGAVVRE